MKIFNKTQNILIAEQAFLADNFWSRMKGLLGRKKLSDGEALIITKCQSIHMFFMRFSIDAIFVNKEHRVVGLVENIQPFRLSRFFFGSSYVIELKSGTIAVTKTFIGDQLEWV